MPAEFWKVGELAAQDRADGPHAAPLRRDRAVVPVGTDRVEPRLGPPALHGRGREAACTRFSASSSLASAWNR